MTRHSVSPSRQHNIGLTLNQAIWHSFLSSLHSLKIVWAIWKLWIRELQVRTGTEKLNRKET